MQDKKFVFPFPQPGQIKKKPANTDAVWLKIQRNEEKQRAEKVRAKVGDALL